MNLLAAPLEGLELEAMLPHRPPILLVDRLTALYGPPRAEARASYRVPADHPILAGHFPGRPIWPGALTIEGLAQTANLLGALLPRVDAGGVLVRERAGEGEGAIADHRGWLAAVDVKLLHPVEPGDRLDYAARLIGALAALRRVEVSATVGRRVVARGSIAVAVDQLPP